MTVAELIAALSALPQDLPVTIPGVGPAEGLLEAVESASEEGRWVAKEEPGWFYPGNDAEDMTMAKVVILKGRE